MIRSDFRSKGRPLVERRRRLRWTLNTIERYAAHDWLHPNCLCKRKRAKKKMHMCFCYRLLFLLPSHFHPNRFIIFIIFAHTTFSIWYWLIINWEHRKMVPSNFLIHNWCIQWHGYWIFDVSLALFWNLPIGKLFIQSQIYIEVYFIWRPIEFTALHKTESTGIEHISQKRTI